MRRSSVMIAVPLVVLTIALILAPGGGAAPSAALAACGAFAGPGWTVVDPFEAPVNQQGNTWKLTARGVQCSFARKWATKLVKTPFKGEALTKFKAAPKGWTCRAGGGPTGGGKGAPGQCDLGSKMIFWAPKYP